MYLKTRTWMLISLGLFVASVLTWLYGNHQVNKAKNAGETELPSLESPRSAVDATRRLYPLLTQVQSGATLPMAQPPIPVAVTPVTPNHPDEIPHRLRNTPKSLRELVRSDSALLLRNAFIDTLESVSLAIPEHLRAPAEPGAYIVQSRGVLNEELRAQLREVQGVILSYIPNNAYLVRMSAASARKLASRPGVRALLPFEPYYKLEAELLALAVEKKPVPEEMFLRVTLYPGETEAAEPLIRQLGGEWISEEPSPFGPQVVIRPGADSLPELARLASVQGIEVVRHRTLANDRARVRVGVSADGVTKTNYLGLTGRDMLVNVNDTGVDATHPDFAGRVFAANPDLLRDAVGHGTHVGGIIAGNGSQSGTVLFTPGGSETNANFRGMAPEAKLFYLATEYTPSTTAPTTDTYVYETAARTNSTLFKRGNATLISNNSWYYSGATDYDMAAARYDAATRDALSEESGAQPILFVFTASNSGDGTDDGLNGNPNTIPSPGSAKNVITVGAIESFRNVTNEVVVPNSDPLLTVTNTPFLAQTDSEDQVAPFSGRGNVGIGTEGQFGRFKPDIVAPGGYVISARSRDWSLTNLVNFDDPETRVVEALNAELGPRYRYESGTSMAAPVVSGVLSLMQEFFERKLPVAQRRTNSPALMKALLINGARSVGSRYNLEVANSINYQGWGLVNLTNALPAMLASQPETAWPIRFFDQSPDTAVATGQTRSWEINLSTNAQQLGFRVSLVWTDPPGNPNAAIKLVNDLDLVVSNTATHEVFYGNDIIQSSDFNQIHPTNATPVTDVINNVENVFVRDAFGSNFVVSVIGKRVNVGTMPGFHQATGLDNDVVQDYALVMSIGDLTLTNELSVRPFTENADVEMPLAIGMTNGVPILNQRVGAQPTLMNAPNGLARQWNFFSFTNTFLTNNAFATLTNGTNVAFITFLPPNLAKSRNLEADIDLYVSRDRRLQDLDPDVLASAWKSVGRGGTELVVFTNAALDEIFYIGVKAEDQQGGEYGLIGISSDEPFEQNINGRPVLRGFPVGAIIPDGSASAPGSVQVFAIGLTPAPVQRVTVTNLITHSNMGDLIGILSHERSSVVLNNHSWGNFTGTNLFIYDDSGFSTGLGSQRTDGPGTLEDFVSTQVSGVWMLNMVDNSLSHTGRVEALSLMIRPFDQGNLGAAGPGGIAGTVGPNDTVCFFNDVPPEATNMIVRLSQITGPLEVFVRREAMPTPDEYDKKATIFPPGGDLTLGFDDLPLPLLSGRYYICLFNPNQAASVDFRVAALNELGPPVDSSLSVQGTNLVPILDDGLTRASFDVFADKILTDVEVGFRINHSQAADLAVHLVSPQGTRILLAENRGGLTFEGYGNGFDTNISLTFFTEETNLFEGLVPIKFSTPPFTNVLGDPSVEVLVDGFEASPAGLYLSNSIVSGWTVSRGQAQVYGPNNAFGSPAAGGTNFLELDTQGNPASILRSFETVPGTKYLLSFAYQRNPDIGPGAPQALQVYYGPPADFRPASKFIEAESVTWVRTNITFVASEALTALEFSALSSSGPLIDSVRVADIPVTTNTFVLPEEALDLLRGERTLGEWTLEITDSRGGPVENLDAGLMNWELAMNYGRPRSAAVMLTNGIPYMGVLTNKQTNYFIVDVCDTTRIAYTRLTGTEGSLALLADHSGLPTGSLETDDFRLMTNHIAVEGGLGAAGFMLDTSAGLPAPLRPGKRYFLAVHNLYEGETNAYTLNLNFDRDECHGDQSIIRLANDVPFTNSIPPIPNLFSYYVYTASCNAAAVQFDLNPSNGDLGMVLRRGPKPPLPTFTDFDYLIDEPGVTNEVILITTNSAPVSVQPGDDWYVGVYSNTNAPVEYVIRATEYTAEGEPVTGTNVVVLTNSVPLDFTINYCPGFTNYFKFTAPDGAPGLRFTVSNLSDEADLFIGFNEPPTGSQFYLSNSVPGMLDIRSVIRPGPDLPTVKGDWYLYVVSRNPGNLAFTILAQVIDAGPTTDIVYLDPTLTFTATEICLSWGSLIGSEYQVEAKSAIEQPFWQPITDRFTASATVSSYCVPRPTDLSFFRIVQFPTAKPPEPPIGGIVNSTLTVSATQACVEWVSVAGTNYVVQGRVNIEDTTWDTVAGPITATGTKTTHCVDLTSPYRYFQVATVGGGTEPPPPPPVGGIVDSKLTVLATQACVEWVSVAGTNYVVQGRVNIEDTTWDTVAGPITATGTKTTHCVDLTSPYRYFQVATVGGGTEPPPPPPPPVGGIVDSKLTVLATQACVEWVSVAGTNYLVQGRVNIEDKTWDTVAGPITATGLKTTHCVDLTSPYRFFQVATVGGGTEPPPPPPPVGGIVDSTLTVSGTQACVEWVSVAGTSYVVQGRVNIENKTWDTVAGPITATGLKTTHCVDLTSPYRFFQVATVGGGTEPPVAGGDILLPVPRVTAGGRLQFTWTANSGTAYALQWSDGGVSSQPLVWTTITNVTGVTGSITVEDPTPVTNAVRFYRVLIP